MRHLIRMKELSAHRLLSIHNLHYTLGLIGGAGAAIEEGQLSDYIKRGALRPFRGFGVEPIGA